MAAESAVVFLLEHAKELDTEVYWEDLTPNAQKELEQLQYGVDFLRAFLRNAPKKSRHDHLLREMKRQMREVVYQVEDTIDKYMTQAVAAAKPRPCFLRRCRSALAKQIISLIEGTVSTLDTIDTYMTQAVPAAKPRPCFPRRRRSALAKKIRSLREDTVQPMLDKAKIDFSNLDPDRETDLENTKFDFNKDQIIRKDMVVVSADEEKMILNYLKESREELNVISIIGMAGLGKTTLAWNIFHKAEVEYEFPARIWIHVSRFFNRRNVFLSILKHFTRKDTDQEVSDWELITRVGEYLKKEKFILVLDDICSIDDWISIKEVLPYNNKRGKVVITSRDSGVGKLVGAAEESHMLRPLNLKESWELLQLEVFGNLSDCPSELRNIGEYIAEKCGGVPQTLVMVGGILREELEMTRATVLVRREWEKVSGSLCQSLVSSKYWVDSVSTSLDGLSDEVRECFLYMGVFPEDYAIPAGTLIRLWIAEGFVEPDEAVSSLEETAVEYLELLISKNLLRDVVRNPVGAVKTCRVDVMIRAFCRSKDAQQNLFQEIRVKEGVLSPPISDIENFRCLTLPSHAINTFLQEKPQASKLRSFLSLSAAPVDLDPDYISSIPNGFNLLRVLESQSIKFQQFPDDVATLIHLRYLTLCIDDLNIVIPEAISQLWNLQTLVVDTRTRTITVKANIWRMIRLRHLKTGAALVLDPKWDQPDQHNHRLQRITNLSPDSCTTLLSTHAPKLKALGIRGRLTTFLPTMSLKDMRQLEKLKLVNDFIYESHRTQGLPDPHCFPMNLRRLTLSNTFLDWEHMSKLAKIETLQVLKLKHNAFTGISWRADEYIFKSLEFLLIMDTDLVLWDADSHCFPTLRFLVLKHCEKLREIPHSLAKSLETLEIEYLCESAVNSAVRIKEARTKELKQQKILTWKVEFKLIIGPGCSSAFNKHTSGEF